MHARSVPVLVCSTVHSTGEPHWAAQSTQTLGGDVEIRGKYIISGKEEYRKEIHLQVNRALSILKHWWVSLLGGGEDMAYYWRICGNLLPGPTAGGWAIIRMWDINKLNMALTASKWWYTPCRCCMQTVYTKLLTCEHCAADTCTTCKCMHYMTNTPHCEFVRPTDAECAGVNSLAELSAHSRYSHWCCRQAEWADLMLLSNPLTRISWSLSVVLS